MRIRITSDGSFHGTRIEDAQTGQLLEGVSSFTLQCGPWDERPLATVVITVVDVPVAIVADVHVEEQLAQ